MNNILNKINEASKIAIGGHERPDGDCVGSCMALYYYLVNQYIDKQIDVYLEFIPSSLLPIAGTEKIKKVVNADETYDLFISLDCGSVDRLGIAEKLFQKSTSTINIDHHISNTNFANINHVIINASSTCEVLYRLLDENQIDRQIAALLYLGIIHDTGVFKHSNTTQSTMEIAGRLMSKGIEFSRIIDESFYEKTFAQNQILGRCLLESNLILDGRCIISTLDEATKNSYNVTGKDLDGIIDQLRITRGVEIAVFIYEVQHNEYKVSMRSNNFVNVSKIAAIFGGGGHVKAAGCTIKASINEVINQLTPYIEAQLSE
jgi:bifunctional oligoribonuclease and PAP phosphatase NrnA